MATKAQVRNKALKKVRALEEGESPTNEVIADVEGVMVELHAFLQDKNAVTWDSDENIPTAAVRPFVSIIAAETADDFGVDEMRDQRLQKEREISMKRLINLASPDYVYTEIEADYY